jgi:hypothetical protein
VEPFAAPTPPAELYRAQVRTYVRTYVHKGIYCTLCYTIPYISLYVLQRAGMLCLLPVKLCTEAVEGFRVLPTAAPSSPSQRVVYDESLFEEDSGEEEAIGDIGDEVTSVLFPYCHGDTHRTRIL